MTHILIPADHASFAGHFPGQPILPGVLLLERVMALAQVQIQLPLNRYSISNAKFMAAVLPGDTINVQLTCTSPSDYKFTVHSVPSHGEDGVLVCSGLLRILAPSAD
jgi:3-hydroxyacyl-[acyl-carrier-protein] dehydratase